MSLVTRRGEVRESEQKLFASRRAGSSFFQERRSSFLQLLWLAFACVTLAPICAADVPGLGDYLNHLARMHVLASIGHAPMLQKYYEVHWTPIPYLAMDAVVPLLAHVLPIYLAGKIFVLACVVLPVAGTALLHYVVHRRVSVVPLAAWLFATNTLLSLGFLNYLFSLGLALFLFAGWIAASGWQRWWRAACFMPAVTLLYFGHAFACGAYCLAVAGFEIGRAAQTKFRPLPDVAAQCLAALLQAVPALALAATLDVQSGYVGVLHTQYGTLAAKLMALLSPVLFFHDGANFFVILGALTLGLALALRVKLAPPIVAACVPVVLAGIMMPHLLASTWGMDLRLPLFAVLLLIGGASFPRAPSWMPPALIATAALVAAKSADAWGVLHQLDAQIAQTRQVLSIMPMGGRLLVVNVAGRGTGGERVPNNTIWHMPLVAVIDRDAFVPYFFNGLTTVRMRPGLAESSTPNGLPVTPDQLRAGKDAAPLGNADPGDLGGGRTYWNSWPKNFDFVLVQRFGGDPGKLPDDLALVAHAPDIDLYAVQHGPQNRPGVPPGTR